MVHHLVVAREAVGPVAEHVANPYPAPCWPCGPSKGRHHPSWVALVSTIWDARRKAGMRVLMLPMTKPVLGAKTLLFFYLGEKD